MTIDLFRKILDKAQSEMKIRLVMLYVYSDPCMHKDLHLFVQECTDRGIKTWISTMLQVMNCDLEKVIEARPTEFRISFPGWEQMRYYQSKSADPLRFNANFEKVMELPRYPETKWTLFFHHYKDNGHEISEAQALAEYNGLKFIPIPSIFMPLERFIEGRYTEADRQLISRLWETPEEAVARMKRSSDCMLWKQLTLDANGDVYLCQLVYEERFKLAHYLNTPWKAIRQMMKAHDFCTKCLEKGGDQYELCYSAPATSLDPVGEANKKRRVW
jgi:MoaA/NifB/PqqE/SkfB family radical SAM enzyme